MVIYTIAIIVAVTQWVKNPMCIFSVLLRVSVTNTQLETKNSTTNCVLARVEVSKLFGTRNWCS